MSGKCVTGFIATGTDRMPAAFVVSMQFRTVMQALPRMSIYKRISKPVRARYQKKAGTSLREISAKRIHPSPWDKKQNQRVLRCTGCGIEGKWKDWESGFTTGIHQCDACAILGKKTSLVPISV